MSSSFEKYRVHEVAKDFGLPSKTITEILTKYATTPKNHMQVLEDDELSIIFEYLTQQHQCATMEELVAAPVQTKKAAPESEAKQPAAQEAKKSAQPKAEPAKAEAANEQPKPQPQPQQQAQQQTAAPAKPDKPRVPRQVPETVSYTHLDVYKRQGAG